jgi:hypothetical protein
LITNTGKNILAKYLIGQAPAYASYIALGCGPKPIASDGQLEDYSSKKNLDLEMFRVPVISRGYVNEDGLSKIVLTAELPTEERYEITEIGIYSAGSNPSARDNDSKIVYSFAQNERWEYHTAQAATSIPEVYGPLDEENENGQIETGLKVFQTNPDNRIFSRPERLARYETTRFLNNTIVIRGDDSKLVVDEDGHLFPTDVSTGVPSNHIHITGLVIDLNKSAPTDELRLGFSVVSKDANTSQIPDSVQILLEFASTDSANQEGLEFARFEVNLEQGTDPGQHDFTKSRYVVVNKKIEDLFKSSGFTWNSVDVVKIYASVPDSGTPSSNFYVFLDALRLENTTSENPLYGLTGYSTVRTQESRTITKLANTSNFVEFRFAMDVQ